MAQKDCQTLRYVGELLSPRPFSSIGWLDGNLLYKGNIDYGLSIIEFICAISWFISTAHGIIGTMFLRCYDDLKPKGETSLQVRDQIIKVCGYNAKDTKNTILVCGPTHTVFAVEQGRAWFTRLKQGAMIISHWTYLSPMGNRYPPAWAKVTKDQDTGTRLAFQVST